MGDPQTGATEERNLRIFGGKREGLECNRISDSNRVRVSKYNGLKVINGLIAKFAPPSGLFVVRSKLVVEIFFFSTFRKL